MDSKFWMITISVRDQHCDERAVFFYKSESEFNYKEFRAWSISRLGRPDYKGDPIILCMREITEKEYRENVQY